METETRTPISPSASVGKEIRKLLIDLDMTVVDLAARMGENEMWVSRRLRGSVPIDLNDLYRMAQTLDVEVADLMPKREGKLIAVGGTARPQRAESKPWKNLGGSKRPHPVGPRGRTASPPAPSSLRTGRVNRALVAA